MRPIVFELTARREDFEALYFRNGQGRFLLHPAIKPHTYPALLVGLLTVGACGYCRQTNGGYGVLAGLLLLSGVLFIRLLFRLKPIIAHRKQIKAYLDRETAYRRNRIELSENTLALIQDEKETVEHWSQFKGCTVTDEYISLTGANSFLIPKKAMTEPEYDVLKKIILEKVKT